MQGYPLDALPFGAVLLATGALAVAFSIVIALVVDLDRPQSGLLTVSQRAMEDVRGTM